MTDPDPEPDVTVEEGPRRVLLVAHTGRTDIDQIVSSAGARLAAAGIELVALPEEGPDLDLTVHREEFGVEMVLALGGDGTLLRGAEHARPRGIGVLGINLGRVGFLAEADADGIDDALEAIIARRYRLVDRMTVDAFLETPDGGEQFVGWALNEISIEKGSRERILDVVVEVDGRGLSAYGCDGVLVATPTGSTAYAFSAGGPVVWPGVQALLVVPLNAHALFARPAMVGPDSTVTIHLDPDGPLGPARLRRASQRGAAVATRVHVRRGAHPVRLVRLADQPFTDRLVRKFSLPVHGWRDKRH